MRAGYDLPPLMFSRDEIVALVAGARTVRPPGLWFRGKVWTLIAWCGLRDGFRMFRIGRIKDIREKDRFRAERDKSLAVFFSRERLCGQAT